MSFDFSCDIGHIKLDVPHQIWEAVTSDGNANTIVTRFFHNTPSFYVNNLVNCYVSYLSPDFLNQRLTIFGLLLVILGLWHIVINRKWRILGAILVAPLSPLFDVPESGQAQTAILYVAYGVLIFFGTINLLTWLKERFHR